MTCGYCPRSNVSLLSTRNLIWEKIKADNPTCSSPSTVANEQSLDLPMSIRHPRKARTEIPAPVDQLPSSIAPMSLASEVEVTVSLISELSSLHCLNLSQKPEIKRNSGLPTAGLGGCKLVMMGGLTLTKLRP